VTRERNRLRAHSHLVSGVGSSFPGEPALPELPLFDPLSQQGGEISSDIFGDCNNTAGPDLLFRNIFLNISTARPKSRFEQEVPRPAAPTGCGGRARCVSTTGTSSPDFGA